MEQWSISKELLKSETSNVIFQRLAEQVEDSVIFLKMMNDLRFQPNILKDQGMEIKNGNNFGALCSTPTSEK